MSELPKWEHVHLGDQIGVEGQVSEIHERDDGCTVFVIKNADLTKHTPKPRVRPSAFTTAATCVTYWVSTYVTGGTQ